MVKQMKSFDYKIKQFQDALKEFYNLSYISVEDFEAELGILEDRNSLRHVYNKEQFNEIHQRVVLSLPIFKNVLKEILP